MANTTITPLVGAVTDAGVAPTVTDGNPIAAAVASVDSVSGTGRLVTWTVGQNQGGQPIQLGAFRNAFFQATGTFGAAPSIQLEGSNDGVNWVKLSPAALVAAGLFAALGATELPLWIRPHCTAGDGTTAIVVTGWFKL